MSLRMSSTSSCSSRLTSAKSWTFDGSVESFAWWRTRWAICATDMRPVARSSISAGLTGEAVDPLRAAAGQPSLDVLDDHPRVAARPLDRDGPSGHLDPDREVVGIRHLRIRLPSRRDEALERIGCRLHVEDMRDQI